MKIAAFTSITSSYLPNARILATSVARHHPEWDFYLLFNDRTPRDVRWEKEPFGRIVFAEWLSINRPWLKFAYGYSVIEFCTATKGSMAQYLLRTLGYDAVVYLDPDVCVFSRLTEIAKIFERGQDEVILTPHLTDPEDDDGAIWSHEIAALKHGVYNLGFFAIRNGALGLRFLDWWERRLLDYSHIDFQFGTFTDQKWANLAPYLFEGIHILCDRRYNVATWNMKGRVIGQDEDGQWTVNGQPLRFYHFSGFGHDFAWADRELAIFATEDNRVVDLWDHYKKLYSSFKEQTPAQIWVWSQDAAGRRIDASMRKSINRSDVIDPFRTFR